MSGHIEVIGYQPVNGTPLDDYADFPVGRSFTWDEIERMTNFGVITPGTLLRGSMGDRKSQICRVCGHYNEKQWVEAV
jgi:hypothetical protein